MLLVPRPHPDLRTAPLIGLVLALAASPALAGRADVSDRLEARAVRVCKGDAVRFCPGKLSSKAAAARCLATKRAKLTPACRSAYDDVKSALKR